MARRNVIHLFSGRACLDDGRRHGTLHTYSVSHQAHDAVGLELAKRVARGLSVHPEWIELAKSNLDRRSRLNSDAPASPKYGGSNGGFMKRQQLEHMATANRPNVEASSTAKQALLLHCAFFIPSPLAAGQKHFQQCKGIPRMIHHEAHEGHEGDYIH